MKVIKKRTASLYVVTITTSLPGLKDINKMIDLFEKVIMYIIERACTVMLNIMKYTPVVGLEVLEELNNEVRNGIGVCQKMKKKRQKNSGHKHRPFCI